MQENRLTRNDVCDAPHYAAFCGQVEMVRHFITAYKCHVDCRDYNKQTPLHCAASEGHLSIVVVLSAEYNANLNDCDENNDTPLNIAARSGHVNVTVKCLIDDLGCSPNTQGFEGRTILHQACGAGHVELAELLLTEYIQGRRHRSGYGWSGFDLTTFL